MELMQDKAGTSHRVAVGVHSVNRFVFGVPDLTEARRFYTAFGLDVREQRDRLDLYTYGHEHCWGSIHPHGTKQLLYLSLGIYAADEPVFAARIRSAGLESAPHSSSDGAGLWLRDPDGAMLQLVVAPKVSPSQKTLQNPAAATPAGKGAAPARSAVTQVRPKHLSHLLRFSPDVPRMTSFCRDVLGLRLSDHSGDIIAFMHGRHGSDHHLLAFAKSHAPGLHHTSWAVGSIDEVGCGMEQMRNAGYEQGWGVGRHVLGSNYFYYVRDPWNSWAEYSFDIDFIPAGFDWRAADHPAEDSLYVWGPPVHGEFINNYEVPRG
ncbi:MAG: VOC family protein [Pseudomonadota bacterium]|nr:VOC family protein [Pseudomonadota bacterium]